MLRHLREGTYFCFITKFCFKEPEVMSTTLISREERKIINTQIPQRIN